jgi:hypothetical protein
VRHLGGLAVAVAVLAASPSASAEEDHSFYYSVNGPGSGRGEGVAGLGVIAGRGLTAPGFAFGYAYGLGSVADLYLASTFGIATTGSGGVLGFLDPGFLFRITGKRDSEVNFGFKLGPEMIFAAGGGSVFIFGVAPGLAASFGSPAFQATVGLDVPTYFATTFNVGSIKGSGTGSAVAMRPALAFEGAISPSINLFMKAAPEFLVTNGGGFMWVDVMTGVGF